MPGFILRDSAGVAVTETIDKFKELAEETGIPYQTLINLYLRDCAESKKELNLGWRPESVSSG